jgi:hypothetical protein
LQNQHLAACRRERNSCYTSHYYSKCIIQSMAEAIVLTVLLLFSSNTITRKRGGCFFSRVDRGLRWLGVYTRENCRRSQRAPKRGYTQQGYPPLFILIQREAFSGFSMRNRGILEKEPGQRQSNREKSQQPQGQVAAETRGPEQFQKPGAPSSC